MANRHGGARKGAGRKPGSMNTRHVRKIVLDAMERGETPLQFMLSILKDKKIDWEDRKWAAAQAAPYCHPRLQAIDQTTTFKGDPLAEILKAIDGKTTGIDTGTESPDGPSVAPGKPVSHH